MGLVLESKLIVYTFQFSRSCFARCSAEIEENFPPINWKTFVKCAKRNNKSESPLCKGESPEKFFSYDDDPLQAKPNTKITHFRIDAPPCVKLNSRKIPFDVHKEHHKSSEKFRWVFNERSLFVPQKLKQLVMFDKKTNVREKAKF